MAQAQSKPGVFFFYRKNREFLKTKQGKPQIPASPLGSLIFMMLFFIMIAGFGVGVVSMAFDTYQILAASRADISARITNKHVERAADNESDEYHIRYEYIVDGQTYEHSTTVPRRQYDGYAIDQIITVVYSPRQPDISVLSYDPVQMLLVGAVFVLIFVVVLFAFLLLVARWLTRRRMVTHGTFVKGFIDNMNIIEDEEDGNQLEVVYRFKSPKTGKMLKKKQTLHVSQFEAFGQPNPGARVVVLYMNDGMYTLL